jgi:hypothetical protein
MNYETPKGKSHFVVTSALASDTHQEPSALVCSLMPDRSEYQPLPQNAEDEPESDAEGLPSPVTNQSGPHHRSNRRMGAPGPIDLRKLDAAFKRYVPTYSLNIRVRTPPRWTESIAQKIKRKKKVEDVHVRREIIRSVFDPPFPSAPASGVVVSVNLCLAHCVPYWFD